MAFHPYSSPQRRIFEKTRERYNETVQVDEGSEEGTYFVFTSLLKERWFHTLWGIYTGAKISSR